MVLHEVSVVIEKKRERGERKGKTKEKRKDKCVLHFLPSESRTVGETDQ